MEFKLFIGTAKESRIKGAYSMNLWCAGNFMNFPVQTYICEEGLTNHRLVLFALSGFLKLSNKPNINITVYTDNEEVAFEWENEYLADKCFCQSTADQDLWNEIAANVKKYGIRMHIKGKSNALTGISRIERNNLG